MEALRKNSMNFGLILGVVLILMTTVLYSVDVSLFTKPWVGIINVVLISAMGVIAAASNKKSNGSFISFKDAFTAFFITVVMGLFISTLFSILLFNFIDPEAKRIISENVIKYTVEMMQKFGAKAADINKIVEDMQKSDSFGPYGQLKGFFFNLIIYCIIGLISALVIKRERPQSL